jgi:hypothetical protein
MAHVPSVEPVPVPHEALSQSAPVWQTWVALFAHVPAVDPVPVPHELLSQSVP